MITPLITSAVVLGTSSLVTWLVEKQPLRTWVRKRRAKRGKGPILNASEDAVLNSAAKAAQVVVAKKMGK